MDTNEGFCWHCNTRLPEKISSCQSCGIAEYCSRRCRSDDFNRHTGAECSTWSPQKCAKCGKHAVNECSACLSVFYCGVECQRQDWKKHKTSCKKWRQKVHFISGIPFVEYVQETPYYFTNVMASDLLKLESNEMKDNEEVNNLKILLAACGDLRHVMQTVQALPSKFKGHLRFVLNDIDPFIVARNVLLLFMMGTFPQEKAISITNVWLSLRLSKDDFTFLQESLATLDTLDESSMAHLTSGVIDVKKGSLSELKKVWKKWHVMQCRLGENNCIPLNEERITAIENDKSMQEGFVVYFSQIPRQYVKSVQKWKKDGIIVAWADRKKELPFYNPTFTGRSVDVPRTQYYLDPSNHPFHYCVKPDCIPFRLWDYLEMIKTPASSCESISSMCHDVTHRYIVSVMEMMLSRRLTLQIITDDYANLKSVLPTGDLGGFDRIYASNLIDFHPTSVVLRGLEPFLSTVNPHAVIMTDIMNWMFYDEESSLPNVLSPEYGRIYRSVLTDYKGKSMPLGTSAFREYYDNTRHFVTYLRGRRMIDNRLSNRGSELPKWSDLMECEGLKMRNFRKGRNKVLPFIQRVTVRSVNMLTGKKRTLEWYRTQPK